MRTQISSIPSILSSARGAISPASKPQATLYARHRAKATGIRVGPFLIRTSDASGIIGSRTRRHVLTLALALEILAHDIRVALRSH